VTHGNLPPNETIERALIHREIVQLGVLILVALGAFLLTRAIAASNHEMSLRDAAEWYRRGQQAMAAGRLDDAIDSLRRATMRDRSDTRYVLVLAQALARKGDAEAARSLLLTLRESAPEDPEINLQLARLAVARSDVTEALRFYHNALYAPWPAEQADVRRGVRFELIRFLIAHDQAGRALSELLALSADLPDAAPFGLEVAQLFAWAGDDRHALDQFQRVLRGAPSNGTALAGAGQAAFRLGEYVVARTYLRRAPADVDAVKTMQEVVDLLLSHDPLASRLGSVERRRRLVDDLSYAQRRLTMCLERHPTSPAADDMLRLQREAQAFEDHLKPASLLEEDTIEAGLDLIDRIEKLVVQRCGPPTVLDQALVLIARQHGADAR
jgi:tetratricopeptide (TPR) repeat protein